MWNELQQHARALKRETYALYGAYRDPRTPWYARVVVACVVTYALSPSACAAITFTERLPALVAPSAQRTTRLNETLCDLALAFGGEAGARQSVRSAIPTSGDTLLRRAHATGVCAPKLSSLNS